MHSQEKVNPTLHDPIPQTEEDSVTAERKEEGNPVENTSDRDVPEEALPVATEKADDESEQEGTTDGTGSTAEDGWCSCWDETSGAWYFHNTRTGETTWENPYVESTGPWPGTVAGEEGQGTEGETYVYGGETYADGTTDPFGGLLDHVDRVKAVLDGPSNAGDVLPSSSASSSVPWTGYYPSVGEYGERTEDRYRAYPNVGDLITGGEDYTVQAHFNSRTGKFQPIESVIEDPRDRFSQTAKAQRQCGVYFDYGSWAQMKGEKGGEGKVTVRSRKEIQILRQKKKEKKEQKRKAFFAD